MSHWTGIRTIVICYISKILLVPIGMYIQWQKNVYLVKSKPHPSGKDPFQSKSLGASPLGIWIGIWIFALGIRFGFYKVNILLSLDSSNLFYAHSCKIWTQAHLAQDQFAHNIWTGKFVPLIKALRPNKQRLSIFIPIKALLLILAEPIFYP